MRTSRGVIRRALAIALASIVLVHAAREAKAGISEAGPGQQTNIAASLKRRVLDIPQGSIVEVRLLNKEKLRGWMGQVYEDGFMVHRVNGNQVENHKISFQDLKSIKSLGRGPAGSAGKFGRRHGGVARKFGRGVVWASVAVAVVVLYAILHQAGVPY